MTEIVCQDKPRIPAYRRGAGKGGYSLSQKRISPFKSPKRKVFTLQASSSKSCNACRCYFLRAALPRLELLYDLPLLLLSAVAQPLAALLPYGCGTPLAGAALESERKCSVITCYRWHNIAASAAKPPRQTIASLYKSKVGGNCVRLTNRRQSDSEDRSKSNRLDTILGKQLHSGGIKAVQA